ncbi:MAG: Gfo/Idh/MocA family oxidoreductase [Elusimicrobiota bacterium]
MPEKIRIGLIGCGGIVERVSAGIVSNGLADITAVFDINEVNRKKYAEKYNAVSVDKLENLLASDLEGVAISTPPATHYELVLKALNAGKNVYVEKPMAIRIDDAEEMNAVAKKTGKILMVGQVLRYYEPMRTILRIAKERIYGAPLQATAWRISHNDFSKGPKWRTIRAMTGGFLYEVGIHEMDFLRNLMCGKIVEVHAIEEKKLPSPHEIEDLISVHARFDNGCVVSYLGGVGFSQGDYGFSIRFEGCIMRSRAATNSKLLEVQLPSGEIVDNETLGFSTEAPFNVELGGWVKSIIDNTQPPIPGTDAVETVRFVDAAYKSVKTGNIIRL